MPKKIDFNTVRIHAAPYRRAFPEEAYAAAAQDLLTNRVDCRYCTEKYKCPQLDLAAQAITMAFATVDPNNPNPDDLAEANKTIARVAQDFASVPQTCINLPPAYESVFRET